jgi:hypothetical protein
MTFIDLVSKRPHTIILNGFDRSGSSAISRVLSTHPDIELFMQPFNSGPVRKKMNTIWDDSVATDEDREFFRGLEKGHVFASYIRSHWFKSYSTTQEFIPGKLHVIKTTINHLLIDWTQRNFPAIDHWLIWREPMDILASIVRNNVIDGWYGEALEELTPTIASDVDLSRLFDKFIPQVGHPHAKAALIIAVRTWYLFSKADPFRVIDYAAFKKDNILGLTPFLSNYGLTLELQSTSKDLNLTGGSYRQDKEHSHLIDRGQIALIQEIFSNLDSLRFSKE